MAAEYHVHLHPLTGIVAGVPFTHCPPSVACALLCVTGPVDIDVSILACCLDSLFLWRPHRLLPSRVSSLALHGALQDCVCNGVVSSDVAKPGKLAPL